MQSLLGPVLVPDVELGLDTTRSDELGDLEDVGGVGGGEHTRQQKGLAWPKDQVLAAVSNTKEGRTWPKDQEVKMRARRRYS